MKRLKNADLKPYSYYNTGGKCRVLYLPHTTQDVSEAIKEIGESQDPYFLLGGGTNSLVSDLEWPGAVMCFAEMTEIAVEGDALVCGAGADNSTIAQKALEAGLNGAGWMNGLPGQLGATVRMNARCYGGEISEIVSEVVAVGHNGDVKTYTDPAIFRGYKDTVFMENNEIITRASLSLAPGDTEETQKLMRHCRSDRESKGQYEFPTCGCVFKNNYDAGVSSGMLLDDAGAKSIVVGGASVSPWHANFLYNKGATSAEILEATLEMRESVWDRFGVWLEYEMEILGLIPESLKDRIAEKRPPDYKLEHLSPIREKFAAALKS